MGLAHLASEYASSARLIRKRIQQLNSQKLALQLQIYDLESRILLLTLHHNQLIKIYNHLRKYYLNEPQE